MKNKTPQQCIDQILKDIDKRKTVDYSDRQSLRRYNAAMVRIIKNAEYIEKNHPDCVLVFTNLIYHSDPSVAHCCASLTIDRLNCSKEIKIEALNVIKALCAAGKIDELKMITLRRRIKEWEDILLCQGDSSPNA